MARSLVKPMKVRNANDVAKALIEQEYKKEDFDQWTHISEHWIRSQWLPRMNKYACGVFTNRVLSRFIDYWSVIWKWVNKSIFWPPTFGIFSAISVIKPLFDQQLFFTPKAIGADSHWSLLILCIIQTKNMGVVQICPTHRTALIFVLTFLRGKEFCYGSH